ncbi:hypothetical protein SO802_000947 [Lithocarpus litseifolius]|uniref:Uncharacterized protein n=1 Tax=Lithocarpus litseifolius TaxID=425828 RepID=A0AAW2DTA1_9ROSI
MVIGLCSRITEIVNESNAQITLEARWADSNPVAVTVQNLHKSVTIGPGEQKDVFFGDFDNEANRYRDMVRWFTVGGVTKTIQLGEIRDHARILVNYDGAAITYNLVGGNMIGRIGYFPLISIPFSSSLIFLANTFNCCVRLLVFLLKKKFIIYFIYQSGLAE